MRRAGAPMLALLLSGIAVAGAASGMTHDRVVKDRQASMKAMAEAAKTIAGMFEGRTDYDATAFKLAAETLRTKSGDALIAEFPRGSIGGSSTAKAEIDQFPDEFAALAHHVQTLASALSAAADTAPDGITDSMRMKPGTAGMGSSLLGKRANSTKELDPSEIPAEHVFHLMLQDCTSCHAKFRSKPL